MDVTKKKKFGLKKMSFLLYDKIFLGSSIWGPLWVTFCSEIVDYTIILGLFNGASGIFFLIRLNYHLSGAITIKRTIH